METSYTIPEKTLIPVGATRILVFAADADILAAAYSAELPIPEAKQAKGEGTPLFTFMALTDLHISADGGASETHLRTALDDMLKNENAKAIAVAVL